MSLIRGIGDESDGYLITSPVNAYAAGVSPYGVYDMLGNVKEWVQDSYGPYSLIKDQMNNPTGPKESLHNRETFAGRIFHGNQRVVRGGGWYGYLIFNSVARAGHTEYLRFCGVGFRVVQQVQ